MDEVKKYLFENRDELDLEKAPRPQVWKHIQRETATTPKTVVSMRTWWVAAAAIIAVAALLTFWLYRPAEKQSFVNNEKKGPVVSPELSGQADTVGTVSAPKSNADSNVKEFVNNTPKEQKDIPRLAKKSGGKPALDKKPLSPLEAVEDNYAIMINRQLKKLETTPIYIEDAGYFHVFKKQWLDMQRDEVELKADIRHYGFTDNVIKQLIQMYQQKLKLLKDLQTEINKMNIRAKQYPALERPKPAYLKL